MEKIPAHIAIIMDGNGRWAEAQGKERYEGHIEGVASVKACIKAARKSGVRYLTLYAFSTENWGRPQAEVDALMQLFCQSVTKETPELVEQGVRVRFIGRRDRFSEDVRERLLHIEESTAEGDKLTLVLAFDYSSRDELVRATRSIAERVERGELKAEQIDDKLISAHLDTADMPDPDLVIRTSGECRLSNFMLWQASYAEMYFPQIMWPDFREEAFAKALEVYAERNRRYGLL
ncbi:MAG: di-trans,poly-cis-decaprenylcistransferase [Alistipes sp.]|nr:di-trans,poly-cis-decaprenylcistransferase [Alistipes sp.]